MLAKGVLGSHWLLLFCIPFDVFVWDGPHVIIDFAAQSRVLNPPL